MKFPLRRLLFSVLLFFCTIEAIKTQSEVKSETKKSLLKKNTKLKKFDATTTQLQKHQQQPTEEQAQLRLCKLGPGTLF